MGEVETVKPDYEAGEQIDLSVADGSVQGTYSTVLLSIDSGHIELEIPKINNLYLPLGSDDELVLKQYAEGATFEAETEVLERNDDQDKPTLVVRLPSEVRRIQRRDFARVPCDFEASVYLLEVGESDESFPRKMEGTIEDISAGGVQLGLDHKLPMLTEIELNFTLPIVDVEMNEIFGEVIRVPESSDPPYSLGVEFTSITETKRNDIIQYVYKRQMKLQD